MASFKPTATYFKDEWTPTDERFKTYSELKRNIKRMIGLTRSGVVRVYRSRRGEWGEWFEYWEIVDGKLKITKQGWM